MPCLSGRYIKAIGPIITLGIAAPGTVAAHVAQGNPPSALQVKGFQALIDTGATATSISPLIAAQLGLTPVGKATVTSATQTAPVNTYIVDLVLPFGPAGLAKPSQLVIEFPSATAPGGPYQALLGRDIICDGNFTLSFDGHFTFSI